MSNILPREQGVERSILQWLDALKWETYGLSDEWGAKILDREYERSPKEVIYWDILRTKVIELNEEITEENVDRFLNSLRTELSSDELMEGNRAFHQLLRQGKLFDLNHSNGTTKRVYVQLIDFESPQQNRLIAANQFQVSREHTIRPDITLFINGLPIVHIEVKSLAQDADYYSAIADLQAYEEKVPRSFFPTLFNIAADSHELRCGAVGAPQKFYNPWSQAPTKYQTANKLKQAIQSLCNPTTVLDILHNFVFYERTTDGLVKITPRYMQYYAAKRILTRTQKGERQKGLIWHTQGSGKSYTMLFTAKNLIKQNIIENPQVFIVVDTDKLASQMQDNLNNVEFTRSTVAGSRAHLQDLLEEGESQLILTTIQKFEKIKPNSASNDNIVVLSDEAHRFMEKNLGSRLEAAMPHAFHFGFTGTPVHEGESLIDRNTFRNFSPEDEDCLHHYSIKQGIDDELILPVHFRLWHKTKWTVNEDALDVEFEKTFSGTPQDRRQQIIKTLTSSDLAELPSRVRTYVDKINQHFDDKIVPNGWKGMVVTPSRKAAALYGKHLQATRNPDEVEVLYTANQAQDSKDLRQFHTTAEQRRKITDRFRGERNPKLLVVHNMLLTGFDASVLKVLYMDRKLRNHKLLQAIARTNRPETGKNNGVVIDLQGVFENIDQALQYDSETKRMAAQDMGALFQQLEKLLKQLEDLFAGLPKDDSQETLNACLARVTKQPQKRKFQQGFRKLQDIYESLSPDGRLIESGAQRRYAWLSRVYVAFQRLHNRDDDPANNMRAKTRQIVEQHVDVEQIKDQFPLYKIDAKHLDKIDEIDDASNQAAVIAHALQDNLQPRAHKNPQYKKLSTRVNEVIERWQGGEMSDPEAVEQLEALADKVISLNDKREQKGLSEAAFALYTALALKIDDQPAQQIAQKIVQYFEREVDTTYKNWKTNSRTQKKIQRMVIDVLVKENDYGKLITKHQFQQQAYQYIVANYE